MSASVVSSVRPDYSSPIADHSAPLSVDDQAVAAPIKEQLTPMEALPAGLWARAVLGLEAPFGFDRLPTVWG